MNFAVKQRLKDIINIYGVSILNEPKRIEAILKDYCYKNKKEIFLIMSAINENIVVELQNAEHAVIQLGIVNRLTKRLCDNLGIAEDNAKWGVESWIYALDLKKEEVQELENKDNIIYDNNFTCSILGKSEEICSIAISSNSKYLAYGDIKGAIHIYELLSGNEIITFNHQEEVGFLQFSSDSRMLLSATNDKVKYYKKLFSDDGYNVIITADDKKIRLWDVVQKNEFNFLSGYECTIAAANEKILVLQGDSRAKDSYIFKDYLYILGYSNVAKFKFNSSQTIESDRIHEIGGSKFDGRYIYKEDYNSSSKEFSIKIRGFTLAEEKQVDGINFEYKPYKNRLSSDGRLLATVLDANNTNVIKIIDIDKNEIIKTIHDQIVRFIEFSNNNKRLHIVVCNRDTSELKFKVIPIFN
ncbi:hypothetical protein I6U48_08165 [Clostridium sp. PL3]|uniref:WD40 repeat domain-containing protein n=1 Tax=Clostridium thailandense TaxID=2794346 RepID=A0A949WQK9_9CLOT|nr:hypothetical protein [Clostridium thailandense]MBV7272885.1 hypothetical protein [Clostridium thailandense]